MTRRYLVTGAAGMLGSELLLRAPPGSSVVGSDLRAAPAGSPSVSAIGVDLADPAAVERLFREHGPFDGVIHGAAYTAVDQAESEEALAMRVNATACAVLARACRAARAPLVAVSTDFVFDGEAGTPGGQRPYREDDPPRPTSAYGRTKLAGELLALAEHPLGVRIARTQWLYGPRGKHFPGTIVRLAREKGALRVVHDQLGSPTSTLELAPALWDLVRADAPSGIYHAACEGVCSWHDLAKASIELAGLAHVPCEPCATSEFPRPARRPAYSALDSSKLAALRGRRLKGWRDALRDFFSAGA
ncbi:MAG: dTDP-4-dehydrorhamnose reductase [Planctomycetes bacterium]|nr:dTDP-4-dehydrorhamnose reductase [Planctomycetota bacterium]